jgi:hypothetical protein
MLTIVDTHATITVKKKMMLFCYVGIGFTFILYSPVIKHSGNAYTVLPPVPFSYFRVQWQIETVIILTNRGVGVEPISSTAKQRGLFFYLFLGAVYN